MVKVYHIMAFRSRGMGGWGVKIREREIPSSFLLPPFCKKRTCIIAFGEGSSLCYHVNLFCFTREHNDPWAAHICFLNLNHSHVTSGVTDYSFVLRSVLYQPYILSVHILLLKYLRFTIKLQVQQLWLW